MFYEPKNGHGLRYDPFKAIVAPRPIGWISTMHENGQPNLAPFSFFTAVASTPPMIAFSSEGPKDTALNAQRTGEFVCNLATLDLKDPMNESSRVLPPGGNEFLVAGLTEVPSIRVAPPRIGESPASLECLLTEYFELKSAAGDPSGRFMVIGEVVVVHIQDDYIVDGRFDTAGAKALARCGYRDYAVVTEMFEMAPLSRA